MNLKGFIKIYSVDKNGVNTGDYTWYRIDQNGRPVSISDEMSSLLDALSNEGENILGVEVKTKTGENVIIREG